MAGDYFIRQLRVHFQCAERRRKITLFIYRDAVKMLPVAKAEKQYS